MGFFSSSNRHRPSRKELRRMLQGTPSLNRKERREAEDALWRSKSGGISGKEIKRTLRDIRSNTDDTLSRPEVKSLKRRLEDELGDD